MRRVVCAAMLSALMTLGSSTALAGNDSTGLASQFVTLLRYDELFERYHKQCVATQSAVSPEALVERNPNYVGGLRPGDSKWPAVVAAYGRYYQQLCSHPTKAEFMQELATSYAKSLTSKQLEASIAFYETDAGRALVDAHRQATDAVYAAWTTSNSKHLADMSASFLLELEKLRAGD